MPLASGTRLGPYEILSSLGSGGMGEVYLAADKKLNRRIAIKILLPGFSDDQIRISRFLREARLAASLSHPNVVTIFEVGEHQGLPFLAMECVEEQSLRKRLAGGP